MGKNLLTFGIPAAAIAVIMGITNPKSEAYNAYASERFVKQGEKVICEQAAICETGKTPLFVKNMAKSAIKPVINSATKRQNLLLVSFYNTDIPSIGQFKTIGVFGNFFTYQEP